MKISGQSCVPLVNQVAQPEQRGKAAALVAAVEKEILDFKDYRSPDKDNIRFAYYGASGGWGSREIMQTEPEKSPTPAAPLEGVESFSNQSWSGRDEDGTVYKVAGDEQVFAKTFQSSTVLQVTVNAAQGTVTILEDNAPYAARAEREDFR